MDKGDYKDAISDYTEAIRLDPKNSYGYSGRGWIHEITGNYAQAADDYREALRLDPKSWHANNQMAWLMATCPDAKYRNGQKALEYAKWAVQATGGKDARWIDTLSAAYAETGNFEEAIKQQKNAVELGPEDLRAELNSHLEVYRSRRPYREEPKK